MVLVDVGDGFCTQQAFFDQVSAVWHDCRILPMHEIRDVGVVLTNEDISDPDTELLFVDDSRGV